LTGFAACNGDTDVHLDTIEIQPKTTVQEQDFTPELVPEQLHVRTIEELSETIVAAGEFWEDWWNLRGRFEHIEYFTWEALETMPEHIAVRGIGFGHLLPASGFESIGDIRNYLIHYYTENWVESELFDKFAKFIEYDGILYVDGTRAGFPRPNWDTAEHTLIEQNGSHAVVETTVLWGSWHREPYDGAYPWEVLYRFTFINGKIDIIENPFGIF
jgi:hypothetical protein